MSAHLCSKLEADLTRTCRHGNRLGDIHDTAGAVHEGREGLCAHHRAYRTYSVRCYPSSGLSSIALTVLQVPCGTYPYPPHSVWPDGLGDEPMERPTGLRCAVPRHVCPVRRDIQAGWRCPQLDPPASTPQQTATLHLCLAPLQ